MFPWCSFWDGMNFRCLNIVFLGLFFGRHAFEKQHPFNVMSPRYILQKHSDTFRTVSVRIGGVSWAKMLKNVDTYIIYIYI